MSIFNVFTLMGGIAMFLYGMDLMGKSLEQTAGSKLQGILSKMTSSPVKGLLLGCAVTAIIQSSGATTVMAVGFVNSGLMDLHQAIGVIMGANVGTTVTGWLLSLSGLEGDSFVTQMLNPNAWSPILGFIGVVLYMTGKDRRRGVGKILLGFAILMAGMNTMSGSMKPLANEPWFMELFTKFSNPLFGVVAGLTVLCTGAEMLLYSAATMASLTGTIQALWAATLISFGFCLPLLAEVLHHPFGSVWKRFSERCRTYPPQSLPMQMLNSAIVSLTLALPLSSLMYRSRLPLGAQFRMYDLPVTLALGAVLLLPPLFKKRLYRPQGAACLALYLLYLAGVLLAPLAGA